MRRSRQAVAEKAAWEWSKKEGVELVTILPGAVCGPPIGAHASSESVNFVKVCRARLSGASHVALLLSTGGVVRVADEQAGSDHSRARLQEWFQGKPMTLDLAWADVRDVARAHILAEEVPSASGR